MAVRDRLEPHTKTSEASGYPYWGWIIAILGLMLYAALAVTRLETWRALTNDMGWYSQALWTISHGHWTAPATLAGRSPIGQAESYALYPLAGIYRLAGQPGILVVQAAALASGVLPLVLWLTPFDSACAHWSAIGQKAQATGRIAAGNQGLGPPNPSPPPFRGLAADALSRLARSGSRIDHRQGIGVKPLPKGVSLYIHRPGRRPTLRPGYGVSRRPVTRTTRGGSRRVMALALST